MATPTSSISGLASGIQWGDMIDQIITAIRASDDRPAASATLQAAPFEFSERQAEHILDMTLSRLTRLGRSNLEEEMAKLRETIAELEAILADDSVLRGVIKSEMSEIRTEFATPRLAEITFAPGEMNAEDFIEDAPLVVTMSRAGYIKTVAASAFRTQGRGGRGGDGHGGKGIELLIEKLRTTRTNAEFLSEISKAPGP